MSTPHRSPIRAMDVTVAAMVVTTLALLVAPSLSQASADARRTICLNNVKLLCRGLANHESARKDFPPASTAPITAVPGDASRTNKRAGFSWLARLLPFFEKAPLYMAMRNSSEGMTISPFAPAVRMKLGGMDRSVAAEPVFEFICPGFDGAWIVDVAASNYRADEYGGAPAITNYFALSGTHLVERDGGWFLDANAKVVLQGNGAMPLVSAEALKNGWQRVHGVTLAALSRDGASNTISLCEGREQAYAAWIDGQVAWTVAAWPTNPQAPEKRSAAANAPPIIGWANDADLENTVCIVKQSYGALGDRSGSYLPADRWSGTKHRQFGPSGNHTGVAAHGFVDGHAKFISDKIDRNIYLHLTTRSGREVIPESAAEYFITR